MTHSSGGQDGRGFLQRRPHGIRDPNEIDGPVLEVANLVSGYGKDPIVRDVSLIVKQRQLVTILGPNGAGKSTLLKSVLGIVSVHAGNVRFCGRDVTGRREHELTRLGIGYVPQIKDVFDNLTVMENLRMGGYLLDRRTVAARIEDILEMFPRLKGLLKRSASRISGGERKMVAIGRVLMIDPLLLVLDEPTAGLSVSLAESLLEHELPRLVERGRSVFFVEQRASAALKVADYAYLMVGGSVVKSGQPPDLLADEEFRTQFIGVGSA